MEKPDSGARTIQSTFETVATSQIPRGRKGKHNALVSQMLSNLLTLEQGRALKIPLLDLRKEKVENIRAAINRAGRKIGLKIATSCDDYFFYVWIDNKSSFEDE
jgi:hypothetical protein